MNSERGCADDGEGLTLKEFGNLPRGGSSVERIMARRPPAPMLSSTRQLPARVRHRDAMQFRKQFGVAVAQVERAGHALGWGQGGILRARVGAYRIGYRAHEASMERGRFCWRDQADADAVAGPGTRKSGNAPSVPFSTR